MVCVKWRMFLKQHLILTKFNRPCNFEGVANFEKQTELPQYECRIKTPTSSAFSFNRLFNSNDKVLTTPLGFWSVW